MTLQSEAIRSIVELACKFTPGGGSVVLTDEQQETLVKFLLLFNLFEGVLFKQREGQQATNCQQIHNDLKNEGWFNVNDYNEFGLFFANRYIQNGQYNDRDLFRDRFGNRSADGEKVQIALEGLKAGVQNNDLFDCYLIIAYTFRNKLFHGAKDIPSLEEQIDCFETINWMMDKLLKDMVAGQFIGLRTKYPH